MEPLPQAEYLKTLPRKRVITSALITDASGRVLCVEPIYKPTWHLPGGTVERGESPADACRRECLEELGVRIELGRLLAVGPIPDDPHEPGGGLAFIYDAQLPSGTVIDDLVVPPDELVAVHWLDAAQRAERLSANASTFVAAGLIAQADGNMVELGR